MASDFPQIPAKVYFRIGEVSDLLGVEPHVLRYWESEFALIKPYRGKSKQRLYRRKDVQTLLVIKDLLHHQGYTIAGAKKQLTWEEDDPGVEPGVQCQEQRPDIILIQQIKNELTAILQQLGDGKNAKS
ncbi:MerR family transcriptional regulator [Desulfobulbus propionicus]